MKHRLLLLLCCPLVIAGCAIGPDTTPPRVEIDRHELIDIGGRSLDLSIRGIGLPTVLIESGMGVPGAEDTTWRTVIDEIAKTNRVCIYSRAGLGRSDPAPDLPRISLDVASDLKALLDQADIPGPYLLVGHSYGGIHIRTFASEYPNDVLGMVLIDATHPDQEEKWLASLPSQTPDEPESVRRARGFLSRRALATANPEQIDTKVSGAMLQDSPDMGAKPVVILSHSASFRLDPTLPDHVSLRIESVSQELQRDFLKISSNSTLKKSVSGGHNLHAEDPELVVQGIRQALQSVVN